MAEEIQVEIVDDGSDSAETAKALKGIREDLTFAGPRDIELVLHEVHEGTQTLSSDQIILLGHRVQALARAARDMKALWEAEMIKHLKTVPGGELSDATDRYYIGIEKKIKPREFRSMVGIVLEAAEGDLDRLVDVLSANAFKPGECRKLLGDAKFKEAFEMIEEEDLKTGKPKKGLQKVPLYLAAGKGKKPASKAVS